MQKALVVDSESLVREFVCAALNTIGVEGIQAADPNEAISFFKMGVDLLITGRSMPTPEKGEGLVLHLKAISPATPVLMISGSGITKPPTGVDVLLPKPFPTELFLETVKILLGESRSKPPVYSHYGYRVSEEPAHTNHPFEHCGECNSKHSITECCPG